MNERVRHKLSEIIGRYGRDICSQPKRCKGLLLDHCAGDRSEVFVLVSALEEQVVDDLLQGLGGQSWGLVSGRLIRRLVENRAMAEDAALWAVESWALVLGVISRAELVVERPARTGRASKRPPPRDDFATHFRKNKAIVSGPAGAKCSGGYHEPSGADPTQADSCRRILDGLAGERPTAYDDEKPQHRVQISQAFYMGVTPVTQAQYKAVMGTNPSHFRDGLRISRSSCVYLVRRGGILQ